MFTQLASWKRLLNMKYEESGEVRGEERKASQVRGARCDGQEKGERQEPDREVGMKPRHN